MRAAERANAQSYLIELCDALGVPRPQPAGSGYEFEFPVRITNRDGSESQGFVDLYRERHFVLEAKDYEAGGGATSRSAAPTVRRASTPTTYPSGSAPPYLLVLDVAATLHVFHRWGGTYAGLRGGTPHRPADAARASGRHRAAT